MLWACIRRGWRWTSSAARLIRPAGAGRRSCAIAQPACGQRRRIAGGPARRYAPDRRRPCCPSSRWWTTTAAEAPLATLPRRLGLPAQLAGQHAMARCLVLEVRQLPPARPVATGSRRAPARGAWGCSASRHRIALAPRRAPRTCSVGLRRPGGDAAWEAMSALLDRVPVRRARLPGDAGERLHRMGIRDLRIA